ncbi:MAG TPA: TIGR03557 family F420-dependent LLM class oxidoreductase [Chloroflexota bacterium]|nr:TIGR03557 family F420-dependent LLM class oxidoreductase [Chloroflexota bacterium]
MVRIGWKAGPEQYQPDELLQQAIAAEEAGFESIDVSDHFHPWAEAGHACFSWTWLGAAAVSTTRIELGTGVTCPILRYHPSVIAQAAATLEYMAPGRVYLGVGTGEALNEYAAVADWPGYEERQERLREAIELIRLLWSGNEISFDGAYYRTRKAKLYTRSGRPIPILISSLVPESAGFAGTHGDGLITVGGKEPEVYRQLLAQFDEGARQAGKQPDSMPKAIELNVAYTDDREAAVDEILKFWAGTFVPALFDQKIYSPKMSEENGAVVGPDTVAKMCCISDNAEDHASFIKQYIDLGFNQVYIHTAGPDQVGFLVRYGQDVLPRLKGMRTRAA